MPKKKTTVAKVVKEVPTPVVESPVEVKPTGDKERFLALYQQLKDLGVTRISQLENLIARAED